MQVVVNLLSNAVKFAPSGSAVALSMRGVPEGVAIAVSDSGPGIAEADIPKLFAKFKQIDGSATRKIGGTGLGLSIVKALVEQHRGHVDVHSRIGEGTTFVVTLPAAEAEQTTATLSPVVGRVPRRHTILVADDDASVRCILRKQLEGAGYRVVEAADGEAAVAAALQDRPDLITMDLLMPGMSGLGAIRRLASALRTKDIPVVIVSGAAGVVAGDPDFVVVPKPVDADRLQREIRRLLGGTRHGTLLLAEDDDDLRGILAQTLSKGGFTVVTASDGAAARDAFDSTSCDAVVLDLHMPKADGFDVIEHVRSSIRPVTPIVVVSGSNGGDGERRSLQLGANVYFAKPVNPASLIRELDRLLA